LHVLDEQEAWAEAVDPKPQHHRSQEHLAQLPETQNEEESSGTHNQFTASAQQ
jgi:hypothetical protein